MFCRKCGEENPDNAVFCRNCGERLKEEEVKKAEVIENTVHTHEQGTSTETSSGKSNDWTNCCLCIVAVFIVFAILGAIFRF